MPGLSQLELDALCSSCDGVATEPSSPIGTALLARKRQRQGKSKLPPTAAQDVDTLFPMEVSSDLGLSQAALDELRVEEPPAQGSSPSSPLGTSLRRIKNRRRWGLSVVQEGEAVTVEVADPTSPSLPYPASWGKEGTGGLSQAALDAMCGEAEPLSRQDSIEEKAAVAPTSPGSRKSSVCGSPPMRKRRGKGQRADAENAGQVVTPNQSPTKVLEKTSPGTGEILSPLRRSPGWRACPLSPVGLN